MPESDPEGDYENSFVDEVSFELAAHLLSGESDIIWNVLHEQLKWNYERKGDGWQYEEARWHFWKGQDEFFSADDALKRGDLYTMERRIADGWAHILMASFIAWDVVGVDDSPPSLCPRCEEKHPPHEEVCVECGFDIAGLGGGRDA